LKTKAGRPIEDVVLWDRQVDYELGIDKDGDWTGWMRPYATGRPMRNAYSGKVIPPEPLKLRIQRKVHNIRRRLQFSFTF